MLKKQIGQPNLNKTIAIGSKKSKTQNISFTIDTSTIKRLTRERIVYSMVVLPNFVEDTIRNYNLLFFEKEGKLEQLLIKFIPTSRWEQQRKNGHKQPFEGQMIAVTDYKLSSSTAKSTTYGESAICYNTTSTWICTCAGHKLGDPVCDCEGFYQSYETTIISCPSSGGGTSDPYSSEGNTDFGGSPDNQNNSTFNPDFPVFDDENYINKLKTNYFWDAIGDAKRIWVNSHFTTRNIYARLIEHQIEQKWSMVSRENSIWAIDVFQEFPEKTIDDVKDLVYKVIVDPSFKDNPCLNGVYEKLGKAPTFDNYLKEYDSDFSVVDLKLSSGVDAQYPLASAVTYKPINSLIEIKFNPNYLNLPPLNIARTFIHEMIHAEIYRKLLLLSKRGEIPWSSDFIESIKNNEKEIAHYYLMYKYEIPIGGSPSEPQHEYMAALMRETIIKVMKQYDNTQSEKVYEALSWIGLMGEGEPNALTGLTPQPTAAWVATSKENRLQILETYRTFIKNNSKCQ